MTIEIFLFWASILTLVSVFSSKLSDRFAVPALLLFIIIGMVAGSEGVGGIFFDDYRLSKSVGIVALIFIIFLGGIDTVWKSMRPVMFPGVVLSTIGVFITALVVGFFATWILKFTLTEGLLLGAIVSSTDAAAVFSVLRSRKISLKGNLKPLLELESGSNDPMAVFLTMTLLSLLSASNASIVEFISLFIFNMGLGVLMGYLMAKLSVAIVNKIKLDYEGLYPVLTISLILLTYALTTICNGNGFLAVYLLGLLMSRNDFKHKKSLIRFHEGLAWLMQIVMFLTLGLLVFPSRVLPVIKSGVFISAVLILLARPIAVFICLIPFKFRMRENLMISWVGLRGAVPIILATFPLLAGAPQAQMIFNVVFFVVLSSVLIQGTSIPFVARFLGIQGPLTIKKQYPLEFQKTEGIDATLTDMLVPYDSVVAGKTIAEIGIPAKALVVLISRGDEFIVANGSSRIEGGDVLLVLANDEDLKKLQGILKKLKIKEENK